MSASKRVKRDFADPTEIALYRLGCGADMQAALGVSDEASCLDYTAWCSDHGLSGDACLQEFFNVRLNDSSLSFRNPIIGSNTTIDGRGAHPEFLFSGFSIGAADGDTPTATAESVILTYLTFRGAGHDEDHDLDPDMIRSTGASHDIWIHKNEFDHTGDSAFDVKVGAYNITMSFNLLRNVKRASLHGSSDSREINAQITTTMHNNAFITTDDMYAYFGSGGRRVPLIRRGRTHMFNNLFYGYRKDIMSIRVGAQVRFEDNVFLNDVFNEKEDDIEYLLENLIRDYDEGNIVVTGSRVWISDRNCRLDTGQTGDLTLSFGTVDTMTDDYEDASRASLQSFRLPIGQDLVDYILATVGPDGAAPFNSPLAHPPSDVMGLAPADGCRQ